MKICGHILFMCSFIKLSFSQTNHPPSFTAPTAPIIVSENESGQTLLYTLTVTDQGYDTVTCFIQSSDPNTNYFGIFEVGNDHELHLLAGSNLSYDTTPVYNLTLECTDGSLSSFVNAKVSVTPNSPPTFTNLPATSSNANANSVQFGDVVFTVTASDTDSTSLSFSMTSFPASPDLFEIDVVSGQIRTRQDLDYAVNKAYDLTITVSDSKANATSHVVIPITNGNTAPIINNLPNTVHILETSGSTVLFTLSTSDPDGGDTASFTYTVSPAIYTSKFTLNASDVRLAGGERFDYEDRNNFTLTFTVSDGKATTSNLDYVLTVNIVDVNENCEFKYNNFYIIMQESAAGDNIVDPGFTFSDDDANNTFTLSLQNVDHASFFTINESSGAIGFRQDYDVDVLHANSTSFRVYCTDNYGATDYTNLHVSIEDVNDNAPVFSEAGYIMYFDQTMHVPSDIGTLSATDADSGANAQLDYSWSTSGTGGSYFRILPSGLIVMQADPRPYITYGDSYRFVVTASDNGSPTQTGTTTVDLIYIEIIFTTLSPISTTTTVTTTTVAQPTASNDKGFWDEPSNIAIVVLASILGLMLCGVAGYLFMKYHKRYMEKSQARKVEPKPKIEKTSQRRLSKQLINKSKQYKPNPEREPFAFWSVPESGGLSTPPTSTKMDKTAAFQF